MHRNGVKRQKMDKRAVFGLTVSDQRVAGCCSNATLVVFVPGHHDVALLTPS